MTLNELLAMAAKPKAYSYVRFSSAEQEKGDSLRRQMELSESYAKANNLDLDTSLRDLGVSAYRGANVTEGALSRFLRAIQEGKIKKGSFLLVESLDRLSRQQIEAALGQFLGIINAGVNIVTLNDGQRYEKGQMDLTKLIISLVVMSRAHEESATKSKRLCAVWAQKRLGLAGRKLTARAPLWLQLSEDKKSFILHRERAALVRRIWIETGTRSGRWTA